VHRRVEASMVFVALGCGHFLFLSRSGREQHSILG
jgi:hypothetical protein